MRKLTKLMAPLIALLLADSQGFAQPERWVLNTLEWPPYMCSRCPEQGAAAKALRDALASEGVKVDFVFTTWTKAIENSKKGGPVGYYPAWSEGVRPGFTRSSVIAQSPVGFVESKAKPLNWKKMTDLKGKLIGQAKDYIYTKEFIDAVKDGTIRTEIVISDDTNIRKVAAGQLDGAILDINNALFFLKTSLADLTDRVQINPKYIKVKTLHVAFLNVHKDKEQVLAKALKKVNTDEIVRKYLEKNYPFSNVPFERLPNPALAQ